MPSFSQAGGAASPHARKAGTFSVAVAVRACLNNPDTQAKGGDRVSCDGRFPRSRRAEGRADGGRPRQKEFVRSQPRAEASWPIEAAPPPVSAGAPRDHPLSNELRQRGSLLAIKVALLAATRGLVNTLTARSAERSERLPVRPPAARQKTAARTRKKRERRSPSGGPCAAH